MLARFFCKAPYATGTWSLLSSLWTISRSSTQPTNLVLLCYILLLCMTTQRLSNSCKMLEHTEHLLTRMDTCPCTTLQSTANPLCYSSLCPHSRNGKVLTKLSLHPTAMEQLPCTLAHQKDTLLWSRSSVIWVRMPTPRMGLAPALCSAQSLAAYT